MPQVREVCCEHGEDTQEAVMVKRAHPEDNLQKAVVMFLQIQENLGRLTYFAVPNNPRSARDGARQVQMGMRAGTPDLCILAKDHAPLFIELKAEKGRLSDNQHIAWVRLENNGCHVILCRSLDEVMLCVNRWIAGWQPAFWRDATIHGIDVREVRA